MTRYSLLTLVLFLAACSTSSKRAQDAPPTAEDAREAAPGTAAWSHGALKLPADSPVVLSGKIDRLTDGAATLKAWLVADPKMFGDDGEQIVTQIESYWGLAGSFVGGELDAPQTWKGKGIDPDRAVYLGLYPVGDEGRAFLTTAETTLRQAFGGGDVPLVTAMMDYSLTSEETYPTGFGAELRRSVESTNPITGFRAVVPITDGSTFSSFFLGLTDALELNRAELLEEDSAEGEEMLYFTNGGEFPGIAVGLDAHHAVIDVVMAPVEVSTAASIDREAEVRTLATLEEARARFVSGRPMAPAPLDDPAISVSFNQRETAALARLAGYQEVLSTARKVSVADRDAAVWGGLVETETLASLWHNEATGFRGLVYSLTLGAERSNRIGSLEMTFVDRLGRTDLPVSRVDRRLGVEDRSAGVSLDFAPLFDAEWRAWLEDPDALDRLQDFIDIESDFATRLPTVPRLFAVMAANIHTMETDPGSELEPIRAFMASELPNVTRFEVAATTATLSAMGAAPKYVALFTFEDAEKASTKRLRASAARDFLIASTVRMVGAEVDVEALPALSPKWSAVELDGVPIHRTYWDPDAESPTLLVAVGLDEEESSSELEKLDAETPDERDEVIYFHARPNAMLELLAGEQADSPAPIEEGILAQRLGPIVASVKPRKTDDAQTIHFSIELRRPPRL